MVALPGPGKMTDTLAEETFGLLCKCGTVILVRHRERLVFGRIEHEYQALNGASFIRLRSKSSPDAKELVRSGYYQVNLEVTEGRRRINPQWRSPGRKHMTYYQSAEFMLTFLRFLPRQVYCGNPECMGSKFKKPRRYAFAKFKKREVEE
jgi:hypothetical protein